jgi:hypothetical protein
MCVIRGAKNQQFYCCWHLLELGGWMSKPHTERHKYLSQRVGRGVSASHFAFAIDKSSVAQVFLYHVCDATTYSPLFDREISQIIRFFLTQNQSTLNQKSLLMITSSCCGGYGKGYYALLRAIAIAFDKDTNLVIFVPYLRESGDGRHGNSRKNLSGSLQKLHFPYSLSRVTTDKLGKIKNLR